MRSWNDVYRDIVNNGPPLKLGTHSISAHFGSENWGHIWISDFQLLRKIRDTLDGGQNFGRLRRPENLDFMELETLISKCKTQKFPASGGRNFESFMDF